MPRFRIAPAALGVVGTAVLLVACGNGPDDPYIDSEERSTRALISVQRSLSLDARAQPAEVETPSVESSQDAAGAVQADAVTSATELTEGTIGVEEPLADAAVPLKGNAHAMAHFVSMPQYNDPDLVLDRVGLHRAWPAVDSCSEPDFARSDLDIDPKSLGTLELLDAGEVTLQTERTLARLVPRAFPTVSQVLSGVMYTTRDQSIDPLPAALPYRVHVEGSSALPMLDLSANAPEPLQHITVGGLPLEELWDVGSGKPVDVTWLPAREAASNDLVVIELRGEDSGRNVLCAFKDDGGVGTVPAELTRELSGSGSLVVHRVRRIREPLPLGSSGTDAKSRSENIAQVDFDFDVSRSINFQIR